MNEALLGLYTFGDESTGPGGEPVTNAAAIRQIVEEAITADALGVAVFTIGVHHDPEFPAPSPEMVLAAIAAPPPGSISAPGVDAALDAAGNRGPKPHHSAGRHLCATRAAGAAARASFCQWAVRAY